jgi:hypothetical protein
MLPYKTKSTTFFCISILIVVHLTCWLLLKPIWPFSDDICYAGRAHEFLSPDFKLTSNEFQNRFGVYVPASFLFKFFGANPYTISFWPMLAGMITSIMVFIILRKWENPAFALLASLLIALNIIQINYSIALFPDQIVACFSTGAILLLYHARASQSTKMTLPFFIAFFLFLGFITKITIILIAPFFVFLFFMDCLKRQHLLFWKQFSAASILFASIFFGYYYNATGNPFYRWQTIHGLDTHVSNYGHTHTPNMENLPIWMNGQLGYLFILILGIFSIFTIQAKKHNGLQFYMSIFALLLLSEYIILFHTLSYGHLFVHERMWMMLIPPLSILSVYFLFQATTRQLLSVAVIFFLLGLINFYFFGPKRFLLFLLFSFSLVALYYLKDKRTGRFIVSLFPFLILGANFIYGNSNYKVAPLKSGNIIKEELERLNTTGKKIILSEEIFAGAHCIYNNFKEYPNLTFYAYDKFDSLKNNQVYVLVNLECDKIPAYVGNDMKNWKIVVNKKGLLIYRN